MRLALLRASEQRTDVIPEADIGGGVAARRPADRALVDVDHLVDVLDAGDLAICARTPVGVVNAIRQRRSQRIGDQRAFTATG